MTLPLIGQALNWVEILANERPRLIKPEDEHGGVGGGILPQVGPASTEGAQHRLSGILVLRWIKLVLVPVGKIPWFFLSQNHEINHEIL